MPDDTDKLLQTSESLASATAAADALSLKLGDLESGADAVARATTRAFTQAVSGGRQLDDVLKSLALRLSDLALKSALQPLTGGISSSLQTLVGLFGTLGGSTSLTAASGAIKPFATGGVIGTPTYFPLASGGLGLAGEAGPEAIVPLARGADGALGIAASGGGGAATQVTVNIAAQDVSSFRGSEVYLTGQIARAVARGRRGL